MTLALIAILLASTNTVATANQPQPAETAGVADKVSPKKICKVPDSTGTRLPGGKKVCMTADQWRKAKLAD